MPPVPAPPAPLPLDRAAVDAAIAACLRAAGLVGALAEARAHAGAHAREDWRGPTRVRFDLASVRLDVDAADLIARAVAAAGSIGAAAQAVEAENRRRIDARREWQRAEQQGG